MTKNLALTGYERGYLKAYYDTVVFDAMADSCGEDWFGVQIGERMFDLNALKDKNGDEIICIVYECDWINDNWQTNCEYRWRLTDES